MKNETGNPRPATRVRGFTALLGALVLVFAFSARPAEAAPFAYVATHCPNGEGCVLVIDTVTNKVTAAVPVAKATSLPFLLAVAPDGKHVYVLPGGRVVVIDTATNKVVATIPVDSDTLWHLHHPG